MNREELTAYIKSLGNTIEVVDEPTQFPTFMIPASDWKAFALTLRNDEKLTFDFLYCLSGVDWSDCMWVVYHFRSTQSKQSIVVKARIDDRNNAIIDTVADIWKTAEFHEREAYDLFGIQFQGHPDLRRLLLPDDWVGWPLRKDYQDDVNMVMWK